jgi:hypothetical protein
MILVESSRYVWTVSEMLVETSQSSDRVIFNDFSKIERKKEREREKERNELKIVFSFFNSIN